MIPVFVLGPLLESCGAAPKWRLGESLAALDRALRRRGSRLVLRRGDAAKALGTLIAEPAPDGGAGRASSTTAARSSGTAS